MGSVQELELCGAVLGKGKCWQQLLGQGRDTLHLLEFFKPKPFSSTVSYKPFVFPFCYDHHNLPSQPHPSWLPSSHSMTIEQGQEAEKG